MIKTCELVMKEDGSAWCKDCLRIHTGHTIKFATGTSPQDEAYRRLWRGLPKGEESQRRCGDSALKAAAHYASSTIQHAVNGFKTVPLHVLQERERECRSCTYNVNNQCQLCTCPTVRTLRGYKLERPHEECPAGKWKKWEPGVVNLWKEIIRQSLPDDGWPSNWWSQSEAQQAFREVLQEKLSLPVVYPEDQYQGRGILILGGGPRYGLGVYVSCRMARHHGWTGPIQVWHRGADEPLPAAIFEQLGVELVDAYAMREKHPCRRWGMDKWGDPKNQWLSWGLKSYAALHCPFREVLYLDADAYLVDKPQLLFDNNPTGTVVWYDLPGMAGNLRWDVYGVNPDNGPGWQGGQWLIDKARCWKALQLYRWLDDWSDFTYHYGYGDQDNFRLAWQATGTTHHCYPYRGQVYAVQPKFSCLRAWSPIDGKFIIHHRVPDKQFQIDYWKEGDYQGSVLSKRNRWPDEDLVHEFAKQYRAATQ